MFRLTIYVIIIFVPVMSIKYESMTYLIGTRISGLCTNNWLNTNNTMKNQKKIVDTVITESGSYYCRDRTNGEIKIKLFITALPKNVFLRENGIELFQNDTLKCASSRTNITSWYYKPFNSNTRILEIARGSRLNIKYKSHYEFNPKKCSLVLLTKKPGLYLQFPLNNKRRFLLHVVNFDDTLDTNAIIFIVIVSIVCIIVTIFIICACKLGRKK